jgi:hypothetical protein
MTKQKRGSKVTGGHKALIGVLCVLGLLGGWLLIGRFESGATGAVIAGDTQEKATVAPSESAAPAANATPWPTIAPLAVQPRLEFQPLPTLPVIAVQPPPGASGASAASLLPAPNPVALPTLAPLPKRPEYVAPPPPPPQVAAAPPPPSDGGGNVSGGS